MLNDELRVSVIVKVGVADAETTMVDDALSENEADPDEVGDEEALELVDGELD